MRKLHHILVTPTWLNNVLVAYIKNQKGQHKAEIFYDEYRRLLNENGIELDEK